MELVRQDAIALFAALGLSTAAKWNKARMEKKLASIEELVDEDTEIEDAAIGKLLEDVLAAQADGTTVTVVKPAAKKEEATKPAKPAAKKEEATKPAKPKGKAKKEEAAKPAAKKEPASETPDEPTTPGVRGNVASRPYFAGLVLKEHGLDAGITDEMIAEVDERYGKVNPRESKFCLRNAWHAIRAFNG